MGAPVGHPFFGNQYTNGGYELGSFTYEVTDKGFNILKTVLNETGKGTVNVATRQKATYPVSKVLVAKGSNKNTLIIGGIILVATAVGGFITYKLLRRKPKSEKEALQYIELQNIGVCSHCGEPLIGSTYVPESEENIHDSHIICKKCGEKNYARYIEDNTVE
jgi:DNA-directed RNA polymerase subunit RPC12/RpoP